MVMVAVVAGRLEAGDAVADVDALDESQRRERVERPVDARDADGAPRPRIPSWISCAERQQPLLVEEGDDRCAGAAAAEAGRAEAGERVVGPGHPRQMISILNLWYARAVVLSRIVLVCGLAVVTVLAAGCGGGGHSEDHVVAAFYPLAFAAAAGCARRARGRRPHSPRRRAARPRADGARRRTATGRGARRLRRRRLPARRRGRRRRSRRDVARRPRLHPADRRRGGPRPARLARSDPLRAGRPRDRRARSGARSAAAPLVRRLESLDGDFRRGLAHCARREIVTSHAAFAYLADRYGLEQVPLVGLTPEAEPAAKDLERLVEDVRRPAPRRSSSSRSSPLGSPRRSRARRGCRRRSSTRSRGSPPSSASAARTTSASCARISPRCARLWDAREHDPGDRARRRLVRVPRRAAGARGHLALRRAGRVRRHRRSERWRQDDAPAAGARARAAGVGERAASSDRRPAPAAGRGSAISPSGRSSLPARR